MGTRSNDKHYLLFKQDYINRKQERRIEIRAYITAKKDQPCTDCGIKYPPYVMEFDHLGDKEITIARIASYGWSNAKIDKEIAKCELVCANCHRERTHQRFIGD